MSKSREAFEKWAADKDFLINVKAGEGYINVRHMAWEVWQAAQAQQPVIDAVVFDILKAAQGSCRLGLHDIADKQIEIAINALLSAGNVGIGS